MHKNYVKCMKIAFLKFNFALLIYVCLDEVDVKVDGGGMIAIHNIYPCIYVGRACGGWSPIKTLRVV